MNKLRHGAAAALCALLCGLAATAVAGPKGPDDYEALQQRLGDHDYEEKQWVELEADLPAKPDVKNLVEIYVGPTTGNRFAIDRASVVRGSDGVIRYTLVVLSPAGARTVTFEGLRCETAEWRMYAVGRRDGSWSRARTGKWAKIEDNGLNRQHAALYSDYFCTAGGSVGSTAEARSVLDHGNPATVQFAP